MWSRKGFPVGALVALCILRLRKTKLCVVFHDVSYDDMAGIKQRVRVPFQYWTMRRAFRWATRCVLTVPLKQLAWLPQNAEKAIFIPVGANIPVVIRDSDDRLIPRPEVPTVAIFGISGGGAGDEEIEDIVHVVRHARSSVGRLRLVVLGRGSKEAQAVLRKRLDAPGIDLEVLGLLPATDIRKALSAASVLLCVRGQISSRRGNAIAGIVCGLPVVGYSGGETGFPITEAGLILLEGRDRKGVADALCRILTDDKLSEELRQRSTAAARKYFSWDAIAEQFHQALSEI
jgi:glycosyltransferase involved in cell wall biosynthesis